MVIKAISAVIKFISSIVSALLPYILIIVIIIGAVVAITSFLSTISLKSTDEELSKIYLYITELDADFSIAVLNEKNSADEYHYYLNGSSCAEQELKVQTNITSLMAYLDTKYQDYALDKFIYGLFGGQNVKDEIKKIHEDLYSYEVNTYEKDEVIGQDDHGLDIVKKVQHQSISVKMEFFDTWLYNNKFTVLTDSEYEQYEMLQSFGVFKTKKELGSPFPEGVLQLSKRYGYYMDGSNKRKSDGIEILAKKGDAVFAAFTGEVTESVPGDYIVIESGKKRVQYTNILNGFAAGVKIDKGDKIGEVGSRTNSSGTYIGFNYQKDGKEMCPFIFLSGCDNDYLASYGSDDIVQVALSQLGQVGGKPYWSWYGYGGRVEWCACFVSWCADQCGYIDSGIFVKHSGCITGTNIWKQRKQFQYRSSGYVPKAGDIIYFDWGIGNPPDHVGIVQNCDGTTVYTVEGNNGDAVLQDTYHVHSSSIYGYATPNYPSAADPGKNSSILWNFFKAKGLNAYATAGILGNLYQESNLDPGKYQNGGPGRGLAQWEYGSDRYSNLLSFAAKRGVSWQDLNTQMEFIWHELNGGDLTTKIILDSRYGGIHGFKNAKSVTWAVEAFEKSFERAGIPNYAARYKYANEFYNLYA